MEPSLSELDLEKLSLAIDYLDLPDKYWFDVGVHLPVESLSKFCGHHSRFQAICNDPIFWKRRMEKWYPEFNSLKLKGADYRASYQMAYVYELQQKAKEPRKEIENSYEFKENERKLKFIQTELEYHFGIQRSTMLAEQDELLAEKK